jgi:hypothetical protein
MAVLLCSTIRNTFAQFILDSIEGREIQLEDFIEQSGKDEFDDDTYLEDLDLVAGAKLNINFASAEELEALGLLSDIQIKNILYYREHFGGLKSKYELLGIQELTMTDIRKILPYLKFAAEPDPPKPLKLQFQEGRHQLFLRYQQIIEKKLGFAAPKRNSDGSLSSRYLGLPARLYARYRFQYSTDLSIGLTVEQDAGEPFRHPSQVIGFDYLSGHFFLKNRGMIKRLVVGDYEVNLGQGLFFHQSYSGGKTSLVHKVKKRRMPFKPHTSANEAAYARGAAVELGLSPNWNIVAFASFRKIDANIRLATDTLFSEENTNSSFSSIQSSGLHRTASELGDKGTIRQGIAGGSLTYSNARVRIAANSAWTALSAPLKRTVRPDNQFNFNGDRLLNAGVDYHVLFRKISVFGELAFSDNGGWGLISGSDFRLPGSIRLTLVHRYYARHYHTLHAGSFGESSTPVNENGLFLGITCSPFKFAEWAFYIDMYRHPWLRYGIDAPSGGIDIQSLFTYRPKQHISLQVRGKYERKQENAPDNETAIDYLVPTVKGSFRISFSCQPTAGLMLKSRLEAVSYCDGVNKASRGMTMMQDIIYSFRKIPLTVYGRYILFQTDSYDARIYAYENDLLYVFSVPAYYGRGSRYYLMARIKASRHVHFWLRWSQTIWTDRETVSSGLEQIDGNTRSEIKLQMRIRF